MRPLLVSMTRRFSGAIVRQSAAAGAGAASEAVCAETALDRARMAAAATTARDVIFKAVSWCL